MTHHELMQRAIELSVRNVQQGGGPFGAVIARHGEVLAEGVNRVTANHDPTAHAEVQAIREAARRLGTFDLTGCELYTTGEPCHMCLCACMWANISKIYYGCTIADNEIIGFRDNKFDQIFGGRDKLGDYMTEIDREACLRLFQDYSKMDATKY